MLHFNVVILASVVTATYGKELCAKPADVAFVIDSSRSIWKYHFFKQIDFVKHLIQQFAVGPDGTHVAALTFSDDVVQQFQFADFTTADDVLDKVSTIVQDNGDYTFTHKALNATLVSLFAQGNGARDDVPHVCILLTDGESTYQKDTLAVAEAVKKSGIKIITIGIGEKVNDNELQQVATAPADENYFKIAKFEDLESVKWQKLIGQQACEVIEETTTTSITTTTTEASITTTEAITTTTTTEATTTASKPKTTTQGEVRDPEANESCQGKEADIVFIVDSSASIWPMDFETQLKFVGDVVSHFDVESGKTQVGLIAFSRESKVEVHLNQYKNRKDLISAIESVEFQAGTTNTHLALQSLLDDVLTESNGARPGAAHIAVVITDGRSNRPDLTETEIELVHKSGVYVFSIGVGNNTEKSELEAMASKPIKEFAFEVDGYKALPKIKNLLAYKACKVPADQPGCSGNFEADIVFGVHGIGGDTRNHVEEFIKSVGGAFRTSSNVRIGLKESCNKADIALTDFSADQDFASVVNEQMETSSSDLLFQMRTSFGKARPDATRIAILIVSGKLNDIDKAYREAMRMKYSTRVIVVGVGTSVDRDQLIRLATYKDKRKPDISHVFPVSKPERLAFIVKKLSVLMCSDSQ